MGKWQVYYHSKGRIISLCPGLLLSSTLIFLFQIRVYHDSRCRKEMQDQDILMMQIGAALMNPDDFLTHLLNKFGLVTWAERDFDICEDDSVRQTTTLVEEFFSNLIVIVSERSVMASPDALSIFSKKF